MKDFPHVYVVAAHGGERGDLGLTAAGLPTLVSASPPEFGGPGHRWSPETLLVGALADCFILTFRAVARASKLPWTSVQCRVSGTLDRIDGVTQFTAFDIEARLELPAGADLGPARRALERAERACLVSTSLRGAVHLHAEIDTADEPALVQ